MLVDHRRREASERRILGGQIFLPGLAHGLPVAVLRKHLLLCHLLCGASCILKILELVFLFVLHEKQTVRNVVVNVDSLPQSLCLSM